MNARDRIEHMTNAEVIEAGHGGRTALARAARENVRNRVSRVCRRYEGDEFRTHMMDNIGTQVFCRIFQIPRTWLPKEPAYTPHWLKYKADVTLRYLRWARHSSDQIKGMDETELARMIIEAKAAVRNGGDLSWYSLSRRYNPLRKRTVEQVIKFLDRERRASCA